MPELDDLSNELCGSSSLLGPEVVVEVDKLFALGVGLGGGFRAFGFGLVTTDVDVVAASPSCLMLSDFGTWGRKSFRGEGDNVTAFGSNIGLFIHESGLLIP